MKASEDQISGNHYKSYPIQPAEFIQKNGLNWCEGNAIKYLVRHRDKKGAEDLLKAKHYIDLLLEWEYGVGEVAEPIAKDATAASLCHTCQRNKGCIGGWKRTEDGGCEGYIRAVNEAALCASCGVKDCEAADTWRNICSLYVQIEPSLCDSCAVACEVHGIVAANGSCNRYASNLRERILDAKQEAPSLCHSCHIGSCAKKNVTACEESGECIWYQPTEAPEAKQDDDDYGQVGESCTNAGCCHYSTLFMRNCQAYNSKEIIGCAGYHIRAKQEAPTAAEQPLDFTLPSIALKCTAEQAKAKYHSEIDEYVYTEDGSTEELVERWDCLQAVQTFYERGGNIKFYQDHARSIMEDLTIWFSQDRAVVEAKALMLLKNAQRGYYLPQVNAEIIASNGGYFTPKAVEP